MADRPAEQTGLLTLDEFVRRYQRDGAFEIIEGEFVPVSPIVAGHNTKAKRIYDGVLLFDPDQQIGFAYFEMPYVLVYSSNWVAGARVPDVMFYRRERLLAYQANDPDWEEKPLVLIPDLVIEIISRHDNYTDIDEKVDRYLADGVRVVWVVDPRRKVVKVQQPGTYRTLHAADTLTGDDVIPGFTLPVSAIFQ